MALEDLLPPLTPPELRDTSAFVQAHSGVVTRKLSSDGDLSDSDSERLFICEDSGDEALGGADPQTSQDPLESPKPKKAKMEAGPGLSGAQSVGEEESTSESGDEQPSTSAGRKRKRKAGARASETPAAEGPESPARSEEELEAADALLSLYKSSGTRDDAPLASGKSTAAWLPRGGTSRYATSAGASQTVAPTLVQLLLQPAKTSSPSASALVPTDSSVSSSAASSDAEETAAASPSTRSAASSDGEQPSTSAAGETSAPFPNPRAHPYYRTPRVDPAHLRAQRFNPEKTTDYGLAFKNVCFQLREIRELLGKETLGPGQLDSLAQTATNVLSYTYYYEHAPTQSLNFANAARALGRRFMILDAVVTALQVLGVATSGQWWDRIMAVIPDDTLPAPAYVSFHSRPAARFNVILVRKLHNALRRLKTGRRLSEEETIQIKRMLFCSRYSPDNLKRSRWDAWRADDKDCGGSS
ncbi:hypothetical protein ACSSS7_001582 [Eimeria intestinalis]